MNEILLSYDFYEHESQQFERDVYILIEGTLNASKQYLDSQSRTELAEIETAMGKTRDSEYHEHLVDDHVDVLATNASQERFLRNMALVALASRLTHALRNMTKSAESFSPRLKRYEKMTHLSEFSRLWLEYSERFKIDFVAHADRIAFVEPMGQVRNQIVHDGAEAQTYKYDREINWDEGVIAFMDSSFAEKYPDYVCEDGSEVNVSEHQLKTAFESSIGLVKWLASELRSRELVHIKNPGPLRQ